MTQFFVQLKKDFTAYFNGFTAFLIIFAYYTLSFFSALYLGDYFLRETDVMNAYFIMQPFVLVLVIPAVTMRTWTEEIKSGTIELLLTQPVHFSTLVSAKFAAAYTFFLLLVLCSIPFLIISNIFSVLDWGMVVSAYIGLALCGALFTAVGCLVSTCCRNIITSFVCSVFVLFFILQIDFPSSDIGLPTESFSFSKNYSAFLSGALLWGNLVYFISGTVLLLWLNSIMLQQMQNNTIADKRLFIIFIGLLCIIFCLGNISSSLLFNNLMDVTENKTYTLTEKNQSFLRTIDKRIDITLYEAKNKREDGNSRYASYAAYTEQLLKQIEKYSFGAVRHSVVRVEPFSTLERRLIRENIPYEEDNLGNKIYMALELSDNNGNTFKIDAVESLRQNLLETDIMRLIRMFGKEKKSVALLATPTVLEDMQGFYNFLTEFYTVTPINSDTRFIPSTYDTVILINPSYVSYELLLALDQYILNGGNIILFSEPKLLQKEDTSYLLDFLHSYGVKPVIDSIIQNNNSTLNVAQTPKTDEWADIRSVIVNETGEVGTRSSNLFKTFPILSVDDKNIAVLVTGKFDTHYPELATELSGFLSSSSNNGQLFFLYDTDLLKDYLYISDDSKGMGFYQIISFSDNQLFQLRLMDKATGSRTEFELNYPHYAMNLTSVGNFVLNYQRQKYQTTLENLQNNISSLKNTLNAIDASSARNVGSRHKLMQELEETENLLNQTKKQIITNYQAVITSMTLIIILLIPCILLTILGFIIYFFHKRKNSKIRRLIADEVTH